MLPRYLGVLVALVVLLSLPNCGGGDVTEPEGDDVGYVRGSCNGILYASTCEDYLGSYWTATTMRLQCASGATYRFETRCDYSSLGGCRNGPGTPAENVAWVYDWGGDPFSRELVPGLKLACEVTGGIWIPRT